MHSDFTSRPQSRQLAAIEEKLRSMETPRSQKLSSRAEPGAVTLYAPQEDRAEEDDEESDCK